MWGDLPLKHSKFCAVPSSDSSSITVCVANAVLPSLVSIYAVIWLLYEFGLFSSKFWLDIGRAVLVLFRTLGSAFGFIFSCCFPQSQPLDALNDLFNDESIAVDNLESDDPEAQPRNARAAFIDPEAGQCRQCRANRDCPMRSFHVLYDLRTIWRWFAIPAFVIGFFCLLFDILLVCMPDNPPEITSDVTLERLNSAAAPWNVAFLLVSKLVTGVAILALLNVKLNQIPHGVLTIKTERFFLWHLSVFLVLHCALFIPSVVQIARHIAKAGSKPPIHVLWEWGAILTFVSQFLVSCWAGLRFRQRCVEPVEQPPIPEHGESENASLYGSPSALLDLWIPPTDPFALAEDGCGCRCCSSKGVFRPNTRNAEEKANFFSRLTFLFLSPMVALGYSRPLEQRDLMQLPRNLSVHKSEERLQAVWEWLLRTKGKEDAGVFRACLHYSRWVLTTSSLLKLLADSLNFVQPILLSALTKFFVKCQWSLYEGNETGAPRPPVGKLFLEGFGVTLAMLCCAFCYTALLHQYFHGQMKQGLRIRAGLTGMIYRKALAVDFTETTETNKEGTVNTEDGTQRRQCCGGGSKNRAAKKATTTGEVVNLMAVDASRIADAWGFICLLWSSPYQIIVALVLLWRELRVAMLPGIGVIVLSVPLSMFVSRSLRKQLTKLMGLRDERIKITNEVLAGVKIIKVYAWEASFKAKVEALRQDELAGLWRYQMTTLCQRVMWTGLPILVSISSFVTYVVTGNELTAAVAFTSIALFNNLQFPLATLPAVITFCNEAQVGAIRIKEFLLRREVRPLPAVPENILRDSKLPTLVLEHVTLRWPNQSPLVDDISFKAYPGTVTAIVGRTGAGKSGLLAALTGELVPAARTLDGIHESRLMITGRLAYVAQTSWIVNDTLRNNILFGRPFNAKWYATVLQACALPADLAILPAGDQTEIGEKGVNLSGGQKQRVSLARAVYRCGDFPTNVPDEKSADVVILDDCLSAVDSHVGKHIFDRCIRQLLRRRGCTVILVTHKVDILPDVDNILILETKITDGQSVGVCIAQGSHSELRSNPQYLALTADLEHEEKRQADGVAVVSEDQVEPSTPASLTEEVPLASTPEIPRESSITTTVSVRDYAKTLVAQQHKQQQEGALTKAEGVEVGNVGKAIYSAYFRGMGGTPIVIGIAVLLFATNAMTVGQNYWISYWSDHSDKVEGLPTGVLVYTGFGLGSIALNIGVMVCIALAAQKASGYFHSKVIHRILRAPMAFFDATPLGRILNRFSKDLNVIDQTLPTTMQSWITQIFNVLATFTVIVIAVPIFVVVVVPLLIIYVFIQKYYIPGSRQMQRLESVMRSPIFALFSETLDGAATIRAYREGPRFMAVHFSKSRMQVMAQYPWVTANRWLAVRLESLGTATTTFAALFSVVQAMRGDLSAGLGALAVTYALSVTQSLNWVVRMASDLESNIVSVERLCEYAERCPQEKEAEILETKPKASWPFEGRVVFEDYQLRYRPELPLVIKGLTLEILPREKVGIVGRTGAGKSSLLIGLLRLVEPAGGKVVVDGLDIQTLGLWDLRSKFSIIPQDPVMFAGALRFNLDPFEQHSNDMVWWALERAHIADFVRNSFDGGLTGEIAESGRNLSVGQRQLLCLARALLRKNKILLLDEATSAVDPVTDKLIQETIRSEFSDCTILTIAHRIGTILDYDRVIVMDGGMAAEFDKPTALIQKQDSIFRLLCANAGFDVDSGLTAQQLLDKMR